MGVLTLSLVMLLLAVSTSAQPCGSSIQGSEIAIEAVSDVEITVYDVLGREVVAARRATRAAGSHTEQIEVGALPPGVYVARLAVGAAGGSPARAEAVRFTVVR